VILLFLLVIPTTTLGLEQAVQQAQAAGAGATGPAALKLEAERLEDGGIKFDDVKLRLEHRAVDHFLTPRLDNFGNKLGPLDNTGVGATFPVPRLDDVVRRSAADLRAEAGRLELRDDSRKLARDVRRYVVQIAALKRERAFLDEAIALAREREAMLAARRAEGTATILAVDAATRDRLALAADALGVDDDLQDVRAELALVMDSDDDVDDDLELRCQQTLPEADEAVVAARAHDPRQLKLKLLDEALQREELADSLAWVPWPDSVQATFINREIGKTDDLRLQLDINLPIFRFFDGDDAVVLKRQANAQQRALVDSRIAREVREANKAVIERKRMAAQLAPPPTSIVPEDPADAAELALNRNRAERRRLRAIARCARAVVDVLSLTAD
jgi:outer membrane protein TolC